MPNTKMSDEKWNKAREMRADGWSLEEIAQEFGITKQRVSEKLSPVCGRAKSRGWAKTSGKCIYPELSNYMHKNRLSMSRLAAACGVPPRDICNCLLNRVDSRKSVIDAILRVTGMTYEEAFKTKEESK